MAKFYVAGITKFDEAGTKFDVLLKLEGLEGFEGDLRLQVLAADLAVWTARLGKSSNDFDIVFA